MNKKLIVTLFLLCALIYTEGRKTSRSRSSSSGRGTSRKTSSNPQPAPTSFSYPQPSAQKPSFSGWQEAKPAQKSSSTWQAKTQTGQGHSYPSSQTGLSGTKAKSSVPNQENIQKSQAPQQSQNNHQAGHSYPSSNGLSGSSSGSSGANYPQGSGLSGSAASRPGSSGAGYPQSGGVSGAVNPAGSGSGYPHGTGLSGSGAGSPAASRPGYSQGTANSGGAPAYSGNNGPYNNYAGNGYRQPPPPYQHQGSNYGGYSGYGGHGSYNPGPQMPGYFGNYGNSGFGGVSRTSSALKGVGIAGAGVGTLLTGLALWNLARSTGQRHHTVVYDNRGQPVAVAPANNTEPVEDSFIKDLVNCSLTISTDNATEVLAIPCAIASSFSPDANVKDVSTGDGQSVNTKCIVTVLTNSGKEYMTTIPCATLLKTAADNNVTEPSTNSSETGIVNGTIDPAGGSTVNVNQPSALSLSTNTPDMETVSSVVNCTSEPGNVRDPINPCFAVSTDLTVIPLQTTDNPTTTGIK